VALAFSTADLARLEHANRALLGPLAAPDAEGWLREVGHAVREVVGGAHVVLCAPGGPSGIYSDDAPDTAAVCMSYVSAVSEEGYRFSDPIIEAWHAMRHGTGLEAFSWDLNERMVTEAGYRPADSPIISDGLFGRGHRDFAGLFKTTADGDAMVWVLGRERGALRFGEATPAALQSLVPAFRAGLDALARFGAQRAALDVVSEPLVAVDADGRELHRNAALTALLAADPEAAVVEAALWRLACDLRRLAFPRRAESAARLSPLQREAATTRGRYRLSAALLPPGALGVDEAALVTVAADLAPALPPADAVRERTGLTRREAEVALLVAEGLTNAEIADRLFIAPGTAKVHVERVLGKLGVPSRAAVAARILQP
jgi:DNA-binding CsgD family transcriptional regulator/PAS domain-containing protein